MTAVDTAAALLRVIVARCGGAVSCHLVAARSMQS